MMELKIATLNMKGGRAPLRRIQTIQALERTKADIILLQETHATNTLKTEWEKLFRGQWFLSGFPTPKAWVALCLNQKFSAQQVSFKEIHKGHLISVEFLCNAQKIIVVNVYTPSDPIERKIFFPILEEFIKDQDPTAFVCFAGDFNCTIRPEVDRNGHEPHVASSKGLKDIIKNYCFTDVWRLQHPYLHSYTWCRCQDGFISRARLDRMYVNKPMLNVITTSQILPTGFTDHSLVVLSFKLPLPSTGSAYWTLNTRLLSDKKFKDYFKAVWKNICTSKFEHANLRMWWDLAKSQIKSFCQQYSLYTTKVESHSIELLKSEIVSLEGNNDDAGKDTRDQLLWAKRTLLTEMVKQRAIGTLVRMRMSNLTLDMPNKEFFKLENSTKKSQQIHSLFTPNGVLKTSQQGIRGVLKDFYSDLYSPRNVENGMIQELIAGLPKIEEDQQRVLDSLITAEELETAMRSLKDGKATGIDGLPGEFYKTFWRVIGPELRDVLDESIRAGELPLSCRRAIVCLIPKAGDLQFVENWRPVSLLCADYKILSKVLANRMKDVVGSIVHTDQTYCVPGRSIHDNIFLVRDSLSCNNCLFDDYGLVFIDQAKAFDRINHQYLFSVLEGMGFGNPFISYVKLLYSGTYCMIKVNNKLCSPFPFRRGIRQGCPLSGLLYVIALEPLLVSIRQQMPQNNGGVEGPRFVLTAYADDVCVSIRDQNSVLCLRQCLEKFSAASSSEVNWNKSTALWCGHKDLSSIPPPLLPQGMVWKNDGVKYLGVYLGNPEIESKNWEGVVEQIESRLKTWKGLLRSLSYRGRSLVINNLIAAKLWHKMIALQPPKGKVLAIQRALVNFFWSGYHWLQPAILYSSRKEGGQGVTDISGRVTAFRLQTVQKLLFTERLPWRPFAFFLLQQAGGLLYDRQLFLIDLERIHLGSLPTFYQSLLETWKGFSIHRLIDAYNCRMFLQEPLFYNPFLPGIPQSNALIKNFVQGRVNKVCDLRDSAGLKWRPVGEIAASLESRSLRLVDQVIRSVIRKFRLLNIGWEGVGIEEDFRLGFPEIKVLPFVGLSSDHSSPPFHLQTKTGLHDLCRQRQTVSSPFGSARIARWSEKLGPGCPSAPLWPVMYTLPIYGLLADIQWRLAHWALPSNTLIHLFNSSVQVTCPFCELKEDLFHAYVQCKRVKPLLSLLSNLSHKLSFPFTLHRFVFGVPFSPPCKDSGVLLNFLVAVAKYSIYKSRKIKIDNGHRSNVMPIFKGFVEARLKLEFNYYVSMGNVKLFEKKWCCGNALCVVDNLELVITL